MNFAIMWFQLQCALVVLLRFFKFRLRDEELGQIYMHFDVIRVGAQSGVVLIGRFIEPAEFLQDRTVIEMGASARRQIGGDQTCPLSFRRRLVDSAKPHRHERKHERHRPFCPVHRPAGKKTAQRHIRRSTRETERLAGGFFAHLPDETVVVKMQKT